MYESVKIIIWNIWSKPTQSDLSNYNLKKSQFLLTKKIYWHSHFCYYKCLKLRVLHFENFSRIFNKIFSIIFIFFWKNGYWSRYPGRFKLPSILIFAKWNGPRLPRQGLHIWKSTLKNAHSKLLIQGWYIVPNKREQSVKIKKRTHIPISQKNSSNIVEVSSVATGNNPHSLKIGQKS